MKQFKERSDWRKIPNFSRYIINQWGVITNNKTATDLLTRENQQGILMANLYDDNMVRHTKAVSTLVMETFNDPPEDPSWNTVMHKDGNRHNMHADNLYWRPRWFVVRYHKQFRQRLASVADWPVVCIDTDEVFDNAFEAAKAYGVLERDVILSATNYQYHVFPLGYEFRRYYE